MHYLFIVMTNTTSTWYISLYKMGQNAGWQKQLSKFIVYKTRKQKMKINIRIHKLKKMWELNNYYYTVILNGYVQAK